MVTREAGNIYRRLNGREWRMIDMLGSGFPEENCTCATPALKSIYEKLPSI